ncbi:3-hydroxyacyl-CoA dehydrogenase PaaH [Cypionkella sp.]|uniref:3-hydroxyacyl-CoA dehydrogenase PaaH n=1 Tax=Cypionkella sp. TaxID=2811411 RepID=UPI002FDD9C14
MTGLAKTDCVAVIGAGAMGAGIAQVAAAAGHPVLLFDARADAAKAGRDGIVAILDRLVTKAKISPAERDAISSRLTVATALEDLRDAQLVIEAIVENLEVKRDLFNRLESVVSHETILATNTSSLSVTAIASGLRFPERFAGLHFFNPAPLMQLVEVISGLASSKQVLHRLHETVLTWGKTPVHATSSPGFIVNRIARPYYAEALRLYEEQVASPQTIDAILRSSGGFRMGPFELMDLIGHDVNFAVTRSVFEAFFGDPRYRPSLVQKELVAAGWLGRKSGRGFYHYTEGAVRPEPATAPQYPAPTQVTIEGDLGPAEPLVNCIEEKGISVVRQTGTGLIRVAETSLRLTDGHSATALVSEGAPPNLVLFDLAKDFATATRVAIAQAANAAPEAIAAAIGLFQILGKQVSVVEDSPGLIVFRTVAMLANEAMEAVLTGVATPDDIDRALRLGMNFPDGPLTWADRIGGGLILAGLDAIHAETGDPRYRASLRLRQRVTSGRTLADPSHQSRGVTVWV